MSLGDETPARWDGAYRACGHLQRALAAPEPELRDFIHDALDDDSRLAYARMALEELIESVRRRRL